MGGASAVQRRVIGDVELDRIELARQTDTRSLPASKIPDGLAVSRYLAVKEGRELSRHGGHQGTIPSPRANPPSASALTGGSPWNRRITSPRSRHAKPGQPIARREGRGQSRPAARQRVVGFVTERPASWYRAFAPAGMDWPPETNPAARCDASGAERCAVARRVADSMGFSFRTLARSRKRPPKRFRAPCNDARPTPKRLAAISSERPVSGSLPDGAEPKRPLPPCLARASS
jgi:hypothetical protein